MSTSGITHTPHLKTVHYVGKVCYDDAKHIPEEIGIMRLRWDSEQRTSSWRVRLPVSVKCLGMSLLRLSEISPELSDILCPSSRSADARPGICILGIFSSLLLNVSYLNLMFLQYSTCPGYWPGYEWPGLCQGPQLSVGHMMSLNQTSKLVKLALGPE